VSSYTTSTPAAVYTRSVVEPVHEAPAKPYGVLHVLTVNVCVAAAITPQVATFCVSDAVLVTEKDPQENAPVGASVGGDEGTGEGAVGAAVGIADG